MSADDGQGTAHIDGPAGRGKARRFRCQPVVILRDVVEPVRSRAVGDGVLFIAGDSVAQVDLGIGYDGAGRILHHAEHRSTLNGLGGEASMSEREHKKCTPEPVAAEELLVP